MPDILISLRHAWRSLRRAPACAALAITILATGIGATTVMYTLVHTVLLRELPFDDPERLVWMYNKRTERDRAPLSLPDVLDYRREASTLAGTAVFANWTTNLTGAGSPERLDGVRVSGEFFNLLGTRALLGRLVEPVDEERQSRVAVLTHGLWRRRFAGDPAILGQNVSLNGAAYTVVGSFRGVFCSHFAKREWLYPSCCKAIPDEPIEEQIFFGSSRDWHRRSRWLERAPI